MSFEGYYRVLCENGHLHKRPYDYFDANSPALNKPCEICNADIAWINLVDVTNGGDGYDIGLIELEVKSEAVPCTCKCGHKHNAAEATYHIPSFGMRGRSWRNSPREKKG